MAVKRPRTLDWPVLSPQGQVLFYIARCPGSTVKQVARALGRTERDPAAGHAPHHRGVEAEAAGLLRTGFSAMTQKTRARIAAQETRARRREQASATLSVSFAIATRLSDIHARGRAP
jgi:hypothetical protein